MHPCVSVCLWVCMCVYPCISLKPCLPKWRWDTREWGEDLPVTILRPCTAAGCGGTEEVATKQNNVEDKAGDREKGRKGEGQGEQLRTFSTDCPFTNRLALCIRVQCSLNNNTVDNTSGPALLSTSPLKLYREMPLTEDGVEFKQLMMGRVRMLGILVEVRDCWRAVEPGLHRRRSAAVREESGAEWSSPPDRGNGEAMGWGWDWGRAGGPWAQEVELEAEAEAVVVLGPRSVLLPSIGGNGKWRFRKR